MNKLKQYWPIILLVVVILGGLFYWYEWRPSRIRTTCYWQSRVSDIGVNEYKFDSCLKLKGLEK